MNIALSLQYFPPDGDAPVVTVCTTTNPAIIRQYRRAVLRDLQTREQTSAADPVARLIAEKERCRAEELFNLLMRIDAA